MFEDATERALVEAIRRGDEAAFRTLVERHQSVMLRVAASYVHSRAAAEDVVQETWLGVLRGIDRFEGRSALKTWIFQILSNTAKRRAVRDCRCLTFSDLARDDEPTVEPDRFIGDGQSGAGRWASPPSPWETVPEDRLLAQETLERTRRAIAGLRPRQRQVITLRDVEGWSAEEVCEALGISEGNQRVLLHRARAKARQALEDLL